MAFIHTNYLTGNDTTGNGSTSTPYKTVYKAMQVAASGDFIKTAGGQWASLSGDFTFTNNSATVTTSVSQVGTILVDDILTFEDGQFGFDKFHLKVTAVAAGNITISPFWPGPTVTSSTVKRLDAYHYSQAGATPAQYELWSTTDIEPNGRTGITISGGWSSDFTTQNGWTVVRRTGIAGSGSPSTAPIGFNFSSTNGIGAWGQNLIWDRFLNHSLQNFWNFSSKQNTSFAIKEFAAVRAYVAPQNVTTYGYGLFQPDSLTPSKFYLTSSDTSNWRMANAPITGLVSKPSIFECDIYNTLGLVQTTTAINYTAGIGMYSPLSQEGSVNQMNLYLRVQPYTSSAIYPGFPASALTVGQISSGSYVKNWSLYANTGQPFYLTLGANQTVQLEDINVVGPSGAYSCICLGMSNGYSISGAGQIIIDLEAEAKTIDSVKPSVGSNYQGFYTEWYLNRLCQSNLSPYQVRDVEGLKTMDVYNNIYFKTPSGLKVGSNYVWNTNSSVAYAWKVIGVTEKPTTSFTATFRLKVDAGSEANWDYIAVQYGPNSNQIVTQALVPTSSFANYTITIDPTAISDWAKFKFPMYFGIRSKMANVNDGETMSYAYVESITVS